ncbi:MAG: sortase [Actinomycetota bacterium]
MRYTAEMARFGRIAGTVMLGAGVLTLVWALLVWQWQDPFTALYTHWQQHKLAQSFDRELKAYQPVKAVTGGVAAERRAIARDAQRLRREAKPGHAIGRIEIGRIDLHMVLVDGTDHESLKKGPGRDGRTWMPGQDRLVYIAGHRTTYLAPFSHIDAIRPGDAITLQMPYATFTYRAFTHRVVSATDLSVLRSPRHELLELQACHPRFFATHRYIVYARLVSVAPRVGAPYRVG